MKSQTYQPLILFFRFNIIDTFLPAISCIPIGTNNLMSLEADHFPMFSIDHSNG